MANLIAVPYEMGRGGIDKSTRILDYMCDHPLWFSSSLSKEEIRVNSAWMLTNPEYHKWEVWNGGRLAGMLVLNRIVPPVDALFHFTLFPYSESGVTLFGARKLLWNFLGWAFDQYGLRRISMEVPEHHPKLIRFARQKLGFRYEGEGNHARFSKLPIKDDPSSRAAVALAGARKEGAHYNPKTGEWDDVVLLRLLRRDYEARRSSGLEPQTTLETNSEVSEDVVRREASQVPAVPES